MADQMDAAVRHRGPDSLHGHEGQGHVLRFSRLAVVAADTASAQPFTEPSTGLRTVVNGEIFNFREIADRQGLTAARGDCHVLHELYARRGRDAIGELRGMFAALVYDERARQVHLIRDPFGIKPLLFHLSATHLLVSSELKGLFASGAVTVEPDWTGALADSSFNLTGGSSPVPDQTYFRHVRTVPPGGGVSIDLRTSEVHTWQYWTPTIGTGSTAVTPEEYTEEYGALLRQAVDRACLSDQPLAAFLSGGIDSVAVTALAAKNTDVAAWTVLSPSTVESGDFRAAQQAASYLGIDISWVDTCDLEGAFRLDDWLWVLHGSETPLAGPEQYYKMLMLQAARARGDRFKVVLTGQGSDEFNGGYSSVLNLSDDGGWSGFEAALRARRRRTALDRLPGALSALDDLLPEGCVRTTWISGDDGPADQSYRDYIAVKRSDLQRFNCWHEDRTTAYFSTESRPVFLDVDLVNHCLSVPRSLRARLLDDKRILRDAVRGLLPPELVRRPKAPFFYAADRSIGLRSMANLLRHDSDALINLATAGPVSAKVLDAEALRSAVARITADPEHTGIEQVLRLLSLGTLETLLAAAPPPAGSTAERIVVASGPLDDPEQHARRRIEGVGLPPDDDVLLGLRPDIAVLRPAHDDAEVVLVARDGTVAYEVAYEDEPALHQVLGLFSEPRSIVELGRLSSLGIESVRGAVRTLSQFAVVEPVGASGMSVAPPAKNEGEVA
ncbi:asparagine synthetase B family protein [Micromonospora sp. NPDC000316]|uniref:asparagine synthetase B family protein n=1 Tax=Micromonospora sp. NPDC000316 TaxID=3364216 RepID=UPI0036765286